MKTFSALLVGSFLLSAALSGCESPSGSSDSSSPKAEIELTNEEVQQVAQFDSQEFAKVALEISDLVDAKRKAGQEVNVASLARALDQRLIILCDQICEIQIRPVLNQAETKGK